MGLAWPSTLPRPLLEGYSTSPGNEIVRTDMESGEARTRRRSVSAPDTIKLAWILDAAQMKIFRAYWDIELAAGAAWCDMDVDVGDGVERKAVRIIGQYQSAKISPWQWKVSCEAEVRKTRMSVFDYLNLMGLPSLDLDFAGTQSLDSAVTSSRQPAVSLSFSRASTATYIGPDGLVKTAEQNEPRFDYDPLTLVCNGLLIEEGRTNLLTYSEQFDNAAWPKTNVTLTANAAAAPDGTQSADLFVATTNANAYYYRSVSLSNATYTYSVYLKKSGADGAFNFYFNDSSGASCTISLTFTAGVLSVSAPSIGGTEFSAASATSIQLANGWYRVTLTTTVAGAVSPAVALIQMTGRDGTSGIYLWGAQLEVGTFVTSYIQTTGSAVARSADNASISGADFLRWYRQDQGAMIVDRVHSNYTIANGYDYVLLWDGTFNNYIGARVLTNASTAMDGAVSSGGVAQVNSSDITTSAGVTHKHGMTWANNDFQSFIDGANSYSDSSLTVPVVNSLKLYSNGSYRIRRIRFFPKRLDNATLQALTV